MARYNYTANFVHSGAKVVGSPGFSLPAPEISQRAKFLAWESYWNALQLFKERNDLFQYLVGA